jgi:hypothetical protein
MSQRNRSILTCTVAALLVGAASVGLVGLWSCSGDAPVVVDGSPKKDAKPAVDWGPDPDFARPDKGAPDQYVWPDIKPPVDTWPQQTDGYAGTPFGCSSDADCFGKKCCLTPWGVKLCAASCAP